MLVFSLKYLYFQPAQWDTAIRIMQIDTFMNEYEKYLEVEKKPPTYNKLKGMSKRKKKYNFFFIFINFF